MGEVVQIGGSGPPNMTVVELSITIALLRLGRSRLTDVAPMLAGWFASSVRPSHLLPAADRMVAMGWLSEDVDGQYVPASSALRPTQQLYAGFIRMLGDGLEPAAALDQLSLEFKGDRHDQA